jgi:Flp pilus assembly protein TadD
MPGADARRGDGSRHRRVSAPTTVVGWHLLLVVVAVLTVYANALPNAFLWDDRVLVVGNPAIKRWDTLPHLFVSDLFPSGITSGYYRPLQALTYALDYRLWGLAPAGFRLTNVLLHAATSAALYVVAGRVLAAPTAGLVAALLFAVHPLHVEAVTYVSGRSDPLAAVFLLLAVPGFLRGDGRGRVLSLAAFFLALLAREASLVLPLLLLVLDRVPPGRARRALRHYAPYALVIAAYFGLRALSVAGNPAPAATASVPLGFRMLTMAEVVVRYLGIVVAPHGLHMERAVTPVASPLDPTALAALVVLALVAAGAWRLRATAAWPVTLGVAWFGVALLPVANLVPLATFMAEHWLYVPIMGLALAAGSAVDRYAVGARRTPMLLAVAVVVVVLGGLTARRNLDWRDGRTLYESLLPLAPDSVRVRVNLAEAYQAAGDVQRARDLYADVVRRRPDDPTTADALNNLGNIARAAGHPEDALASFERAIALRPDHVAARNGRALALQALGRNDEAERELETARAIDPTFATTHSNLGNLYFRRDEIERARDAYLAALRLDPEHADAHNNLGSAYFRLGDRERAAHEYREALRLDPLSAGAQRNLAIVLGTPAAHGEP